MPTDPPPSRTEAPPAGRALSVSPGLLAELAGAVRQVAGLLEETAAALPAVGHAAAQAPDPVPWAAQMLAADARAALTAEAVALHRVARALVEAAASYAGTDRRLAATMGSR